VPTCRAKEGARAVAGDDENGDEEEAEGFLLIDARLLGSLLFPFAMAEIGRVPPANDTEAPPPAPQSG
jgi:hypothetical protein